MCEGGCSVSKGGAIFDLDGTVIDSMMIWDTVAEDYLISLGIQPEENLHQDTESFTIKQTAGYFQKHYGITLSTERIFADWKAIIALKYKTMATLKPGIKDYLCYLKDKGVIVCAATATDRDISRETIERLGILDCFSNIFSCDENGRGKDDPDIYRRALEFLGTKKEETVVFEDTLFALKTAKKDGFVTVGVYDRFEKRQNEIETLVDYYVRDFNDPVLKVIYP